MPPPENGFHLNIFDLAVQMRRCHSVSGAHTPLRVSLFGASPNACFYSQKRNGNASFAHGKIENTKMKVRFGEGAETSTRGRVRSPDERAILFRAEPAATRFSAPPATINSWAAGLSGGKANDFPSMVRMDLP